MRLWRHDAQQLIAIKRGEFKLEEIKSMADDLFKKSEEALIRSKLPTHPNVQAAESLLMEILQEKLAGKCYSSSSPATVIA